jgi:hypothetical protein
MKAKAKYLILFPAFTFATVSFGGGNDVMRSVDRQFSTTLSGNDISPRKYSFCDAASTAVFISKPMVINETEAKNELAYKEKLNALSQTVQNFLKIKLKKRKHR